jgi:hypothetical protein
MKENERLEEVHGSTLGECHCALHLVDLLQALCLPLGTRTVGIIAVTIAVADEMTDTDPPQRAHQAGAAHHGCRQLNHTCNYSRHDSQMPHLVLFPPLLRL